MLKYDLKQRFSAEECMNHPWFKADESNNTGKTKISANLITNMKKFKADRKLEQATVSLIVT